MLLIFNNQRKLEQQNDAQSPRPIDTFFSEPLLEVMEERFIHHHHNPKLAQVLVQIEVKTFIVLPSPGAIFANVFFSGVKGEAKVAQLINIYSDWLVVLPSAQESPNAIVVHADQVAADPVIIAKALSRFGLIGGCITEQEVRTLFEQAITMTPYISEAKYGKGYDPFGAIREPTEFGRREIRPSASRHAMQCHVVTRPGPAVWPSPFGLLHKFVQPVQIPAQLQIKRGELGDAN